ncbi:hypothetical protein GCM10020254_25840 [Streptomyces goshikiensis]
MTTPTSAVPGSRGPAATAGLTAAIDIGGTKVAGALVHPDGTMTATTRRPTPRDADADGVFAAVAEVVAELARSPLWPSVVRCGVGSAGPVDTSRGTVSPVNIGAWRDFPVQERVAAELARHGAAVPTVLAGDGVAMTAAEHWLGAARGHANALCMVVSTGVGGGLILNNQLHPGPTGNAGHIGHISVAFDGERCVCGGHGCVESLASGTAIARWALAQGWTPRRGPHGGGRRRGRRRRGPGRAGRLRPRGARAGRRHRGHRDPGRNGHRRHRGRGRRLGGHPVRSDPGAPGLVRHAVLRTRRPGRTGPARHPRGADRRGRRRPEPAAGLGLGSRHGRSYGLTER